MRSRRRRRAWGPGDHRFNSHRRRRSARGWALSVAAVALMLASAAGGDELELTDGRRFEGRLIKRTTTSVTFKIVYPYGGVARMTFPASRVKSVKVTGTEPVVTKPPKPKPTTRPAPADRPAQETPPEDKPLTNAQVRAIIAKAGATQPEWWDSVPLNYPKTLDLAGTRKVQGWHPQVKLGAYMFSVIKPNPGKWKGAVRLLHHVVDVRKNDPQRLPEARRMLAEAYLQLMRDPARAAFWWEKAIGRSSRVGMHDLVGLGECYYLLGSKSMAVQFLRKYNVHRGGDWRAVRLWAKMGELPTALAVAGAFVRAGRPDDGLLAAGDACRIAGRHKQALDYYNKVISLKKGWRGLARNKERARARVEAVRAQQALDVSNVADGTYTGDGEGFRGTVSVEVKVAGGRIESVRVTRHREDLSLDSLTEVPQRIVKAQSPSVQPVTGATVSSDAVKDAVIKALAKGMKK